MSEKTILLEIFQPFAQYRNPFTFYYAQTFPLPPKSTIIGMLQNATDHYYDEEFWNFKVSVHGGFESTFWNYQSLIKAAKTGISIVKYRGKLTLYNQNRPLYGEGLTSQRSPVYQQELFNGHIYIFLRGPEHLINEVENALKNPRKILYLGRSEDVIFIKKIHEVVFEKKRTNSKFFRLQFPTYIKLRGFSISKDKFPVYSIGTKVIFKNDGKSVKNKGEIIMGKTEREPEFEPVIYTGTDFIVTLSDNIVLDIYKLEENGNKKVFKIPEEYGWL